jgi:hypothetical protein
VAFASLVVGIPSLLAGVTFPLLSGAFVVACAERTPRGGRFYSANLAGDALGVVLGGVLLPFACVRTGSTLKIAVKDAGG